MRERFDRFIDVPAGHAGVCNKGVATARYFFPALLDVPFDAI